MIASVDWCESILSSQWNVATNHDMNKYLGQAKFHSLPCHVITDSIHQISDSYDKSTCLSILGSRELDAISTSNHMFSLVQYVLLRFPVGSSSHGPFLTFGYHRLIEVCFEPFS